MKRLLRSIIDFDSSVPQDALASNYQKIVSSTVEWSRADEDRIFRFVKSYFRQRLELPGARTVFDYFEKTGDVEATERLKDLAAAPTYTRSNFSHLLQGLLEDQNRVKAIAALKEAHEMMTKGVTIDDVRHFGVRDALLHFTQKANQLIIPESNARVQGNIREDAQIVWDEYQTAKVNKDKAWGRFTGINNIDKICRGIKKGELWVHAAFAGELKCLPGDVTLYDHTAKKRRTLAELHASGDLPVVTALEYEGQGALIQTPTSHLVQNGIREVFTVTLESGRRLPGSDNHQLLTPGGWTEIRDLQRGDWVAVPRHTRVAQPNHDFTDAEVRAVGYLIGDGGLKESILFTASNDEIREDFVSCLLDMGLQEGPADYITPSFSVETPDDGVHPPYVRVSNSLGQGNSSMVSPVRLLLDALGLYGKGSYDKRIPDELFGLTEKQTAILLGALWSTDGSCHVGEHVRKDRDSLCKHADIGYSSVSEDLCLDVQSLLLRLGIASTVRIVNTTYKGEPYRFFTTTVVTNPSKRAFVKLIRVVGKEDSFAALARAIPDGDNRPIPSCFLPDGRRVVMPRGYFRYSRHVRVRPTVTADEMLRFVTPDDHALRRALSGDVAWERVESIELRGLEMTYDLSVPEHHTFVANDVVTHNTTFATNWCYNLITRYRANIYYGSLEMKYEHIRRLIYVIHTANERFKQMGYKPLDYRKVRDGELSPEEEAFWQIAVQDFAENPEYCDFDTWAPDRDITVEDMRNAAEILHQQKELGLVVIDHGGLAEARKTKKNKDYVVELNSVIRDAKKFALQFNHGEGIPVLLLFQINRDGKDYADKNEGEYKMRALSYANETERSADVITTTYLNKDFRDRNVTKFCCLKNRDNPLFESFDASVDFVSRRIFNADPYAGSDGRGISVDDNRQVMDIMGSV
jgi:intein/homing endonuclease